MYIIIDLEATCWENSHKGESEIIEIGAVIVDTYYKILGKYQTFIKPTKNPVLSQYCKDLTSISQKEVDDAEIFPVVFENFINWTNENVKCNIESIIFCSWGYYDKRQLMKDCVFHSIKYPFSNHRSLKHEFAKQRKIKPVGMKRALQMCEIKLKGTHHRALDDTENITQIFIKDKMAQYGKG